MRYRNVSVSATTILTLYVILFTFYVLRFFFYLFSFRHRITLLEDWTCQRLCNGRFIIFIKNEFNFIAVFYFLIKTKTRHVYGRCNTVRLSFNYICNVNNSSLTSMSYRSMDSIDLKLTHYAKCL